MKYIKLSNGKVGYIENVKNKQFIEDLKRNNLTYEMISQDEYEIKSINQKLSPEQIYKYVLNGKKDFE
jgi:hypothetical protein